MNGTAGKTVTVSRSRTSSAASRWIANGAAPRRNASVAPLYTQPAGSSRGRRCGTAGSRTGSCRRRSDPWRRRTPRPPRPAGACVRGTRLGRPVVARRVEVDRVVVRARRGAAPDRRRRAGDDPRPEARQRAAPRSSVRIAVTPASPKTNVSSAGLLCGLSGTATAPRRLTPRMATAAARPLRQHDRHRVPRLHTLRGQAAGEALGLLAQVGAGGARVAKRERRHAPRARRTAPGPCSGAWAFSSISSNSSSGSDCMTIAPPAPIVVVSPSMTIVRMTMLRSAAPPSPGSRSRPSRRRAPRPPARR